MSVLRNLRNLSTMEFYKNALDLKFTVTEWMLKDFGIKRNIRSVTQVIKNISKEDQYVIDSIFEKYGRSQNQQYQSEFPSWYIEFEKNKIMQILSDMMDYIITANSIYATRDFEFDLRREYQDKAISCCYRLYHELYYIISIVYNDLNKLSTIIDKIDKQVDLLKGWRQSDNKARGKA